MSDTLADLLIRDHRRLQTMGRELRTACAAADASEGDCFRRFRAFKALMVAHAKAEEYTAYALYEDERNAIELRRFVLEGYEEHDLVDLMLKEMGQAEELTDPFRAKLNVLLELFENHVRDEEASFIPELRRRLSAEQLLDLGVVYARERDEIFAKKSGLKAPAPVYNRNSMTH